MVRRLQVRLSFSWLSRFVLFPLAFLLFFLLGTTAFGASQPGYVEWRDGSTFDRNQNTTGQTTTKTNIWVDSNSDTFVWIPEHNNVGPSARVGMIGGSGQSDVGLRIDAGPGNKAIWSFISMENYKMLNDDLHIRVAFRTSDDGNTWSLPMGSDGLPVDINESGIYLLDDPTYQPTQIPLTSLPKSRFLDVTLRFDHNADYADNCGLAMAAVGYSLPMIRPNGTLIREYDIATRSPLVFVLKEGKACPIECEAAFESYGYRWDRVFTNLLPEDVEIYPPGESIGIRPGSLIQCTWPGVYIVDYQPSEPFDMPLKRPIESAAEFSTFGFQWNDIYSIHELFMESYAVSKPLKSFFFNGDLFRAANDSTVYHVEKQLARPVSSWTSFISNGLKPWRIRTVASIRSLPVGFGKPLKIRAGTLVKGTGQTVYVIDELAGDYYRRPIESATVFESYGLYWEDIITIPDSELLSYVVGEPLK